MSRADRRRHPRKTYFCEARIEGLGTGRAACRVADISLGGVFVEAMTVLPPGTSTRVQFALPGHELAADAEVRYSQQGIGMGLRFVALSELDRAAIQAYLLARPPAP